MDNTTKKLLENFKKKVQRMEKDNEKDIKKMLKNLPNVDNVPMDKYFNNEEQPVQHPFYFDIDFECRPLHIEKYTPEYKTKGAVGCDIKADIKEPITLKPLERFAFPTGLYYKLPFNVEMQIRSRSGLSYRYGVAVLNDPATIDPDYVNEEIKVILVNNSNHDYTVKVGERIAQIVFAPILRVKHNSKDLNKLCENEDKRGGLGSTGQL